MSTVVQNITPEDHPVEVNQAEAAHEDMTKANITPVTFKEDLGSALVPRK